MPSRRKLFLNGHVYFISTRIEEGLPMLPLSFMNLVLLSILARAQRKYPVVLCHFLFEANHFHLLLVVTDPELVPAFIGYIKQESAHAINRFLGRRQKTVWQQGYDSPVLLTAKDVRSHIRYLYLNPVKDNLVEKIHEYPGVSSWEMMTQGLLTLCVPLIARSSIIPLTTPDTPWKEEKTMTTHLLKANPSFGTLTLSPFVWKLCFDETKEMTDDALYALLLTEIQEQETLYAEQRATAKKKVWGVRKLREQSMRTPYTPTKVGRKMVCCSHDKQKQRAFLVYHTASSKQAENVYARWKQGDFSLTFPPGLFPPRRPLLANIIPPLLSE